ncbi:MAG TPA: hypothetical protein DG753_04520 [Clostridium sp.]|nr:hypothetical protein [Clostridium sp.]
MSKGMNEILRGNMKFDLIIGLFISLLIVLLSNFSNAIIYCVGIGISLLNFIGNGYVMTKLTSTDTKGGHGIILILITFLRLGIVLLCAVPFIEDVKKMAFYVAGFISHYLMLISYCLITRKGSV